MKAWFRCIGCNQQKIIEQKEGYVPICKSCGWPMWPTERKVKNGRMKCPNCKGTGFVGNSCCRRCEGSMSIEVPDESL